MKKEYFKTFCGLLFVALFIIGTSALIRDTQAQPSLQKNIGGHRIDQGKAVFAEGVIPQAGSHALLKEDANFAQLAAQDSLELVLSNSADSVIVVVTAMRADSTIHRFTNVTVKGADTTTVGGQLLYFESIEVIGGKQLAGTLTVNRATGNTYITKIIAGKTDVGVAHYFTGKQGVSELIGWKIGTETALDTIRAELRLYDDPRASRGTATTLGHRVLDKLTIVPGSEPVVRGDINVPILLPESSWVTISATSTTAGAQIYGRMEFGHQGRR
jgi:hypothetical protein